ncbi:glycoside hydrolase family 99-like domain-containing protein [Sulfitobacter sp. F26169L]|uniref:glycoside hydrolase family 99-like domain-containing protein n=1 Tax=Sulfitobacter sp. F26169L TaxID=2996015 RepID=UPI002260CA32|nr:glycoside hydrolase family 99-like domain-containing protein [Sulfitobacter sp. F26169L]MCX7568053.1 glycoside hydrolase family 99-like domain-containing protein [Sulfitobacter sp. F26169L]
MASNSALRRALRFLRIFFLGPNERAALKAGRNSGLFDPVYYRGAYPQVHPLFRPFLLRHYIVYGESMGYRPNPDFSPSAYLRYNPDVATQGTSPFLHYATSGHKEQRITKELPKVEELPEVLSPKLRFDSSRVRSDVAVVMHIYYPDLWPEFRAKIGRLDIEHDLFVTLTYRGDETEELAAQIREEFPDATVVPLENRGRDILPFLALVNAGMLSRYKAVCKIHTKKSPHREDGEKWRRHLIDGVLPDEGLKGLLETFIADEKASFWVADGQHFDDTKWWGSNLEITRSLLRRIEVEITGKRLSFPAGSIYWMKPVIIDLLRAMRLNAEQFDPEMAQVDGTLAHALERTMGFLSDVAELEIRQTTQVAQIRDGQLKTGSDTGKMTRPAFVSTFYLPQFHPFPENDAWWGKGFTEWRGTVTALPMFAGHTQPLLPTDLGFYDLRATEVMGEQAALAQAHGIDAFCVYHYWFDGKRLMETPLDKLLERPEIDFPFYLCWANESWRRNWDGLSGVVLMGQTYQDGFEQALVEDSLKYMRDPRYMRPDGTRPRFVIYRPEDMPDPVGSVARMRDAWKAAGIGEVELGAVCFHIGGETPVADDLFDFWVEMPPHGIVTSDDYLFGGPEGNKLDREVHGGFKGLVYDYNKVIDNSVSQSYVKGLPDNTICGVMPSWDNTARRGFSAHMAYGANPARFGVWLDQMMRHRVAGSYRNEMFVNAWNEWAEKAVMEPNAVYGDVALRTLGSKLGKETS